MTKKAEIVEIEFDSETNEFHINMYDNATGIASFITKEVIILDNLKIKEEEGAQILCQNS